jgi:hypothetical protein
MYNVNFTNNTATEAGIDMFENKTEEQSFYSDSTLQACCSDSKGDYLFALWNSIDKSDLLPICIPPAGERFISSNGSDTRNACVNRYIPCESLAYAIVSGRISLQVAISVTVIGEYEGSDTNIPVEEAVCIRRLEDSPSVIVFLSFFLFIWEFCVCNSQAA